MRVEAIGERFRGILRHKRKAIIRFWTFCSNYLQSFKVKSGETISKKSRGDRNFHGESCPKENALHFFNRVKI